MALASSLQAGLTAEGYSVDVAHDGILGFELARTGAYALMVLDLMLPGRNGYDICRRLRAEQIATPILVLTAKDGVHDHADALDSGADDLLANRSPTWCCWRTCGPWTDDGRPRWCRS